ncbi:MAG: alpha-L-fucosidase [Chthoniobacterales bacterium]
MFASPQIPEPSNRVARFERLGYGLFIHWGLYSQLGQGEWIQHHKGISVSDYEKLAGNFTAADFDARAFARLARESGMRYITLTTRHHDGFSLYDTRGLSTFDSPHSPAGRDIVAEFVEACRAEDIVPFLYHTTLDWRWGSANCSESKFDDYLDYLHASVEVLCRNYGEIGGFWFDGNWSREHADWKEDRLFEIIRRFQPEAMIINNTGLDAQGAKGHPEIDSTTFEQGLPIAPDRRGWSKYVAGEMCETMNSHWGIGARDYNFKSPAAIIQHLCACRRVGANYLLNIGPTATGGIPAYEAAALRIVGKWIESHGDLIYDARPFDARCEGKDFVLHDEGRFFYFAHDLGRRGDAHVVKHGNSNASRIIDYLPVGIQSVRWLDDCTPGIFSQSSDGKVTLNCEGYDYGIDMVVRVAELTA